MSRTGPSQRFEDATDAVRRVARFGAALVQAHRLGQPSCASLEPWSVAFHRAALPIYTSVLPWEYLVGLANRFVAAADYVEANSAGKQYEAAHGRVVVAYLSTASQVINSAAPDIHPESVWTTFKDYTPPVVPFGDLATLVTTTAARQLESSANAVLEALEDHTRRCDEPLNEFERTWMSDLASGRPVIDIAADAGISKRTLHRRLSAIYKRIGAGNRSEALAIAIERGWIASS